MVAETVLVLALVAVVVASDFATVVVAGENSRN